MEAEARRRHEEGEKTDLFKLMHKHDKERLTSGIWERALDHGDHLAEELIERAIEALGTGIASAVNLLDPEAVVLGGGLGVRFGDRCMKPLRKEMGVHLFVNERPPALRVAALGDLGGAIGASLLFTR
jgi:glucokinase